MEYVVDQENTGKAIDTYDQFIGAEVCLPNEQGSKMMARFTKNMKYNESKTRGIEHPTLFSYHSLYQVSFPNDQTEYLTENVIDDNMLYQVYSEGHNYQVIKYISDHYADGSALNRSGEFIRNRGGNLHAKKTTRGWKLEVKCKDETVSRLKFHPYI